MSAPCGRVEYQYREWSSQGGKLLCFQRWTIDASLIHDAGFVENIAFAKLILKRPAYLGRDNQPDLSENSPSFHSFTSFVFNSPFLSFFLALFLSLFFVHFLLSFLYFLSFLHSHLSCLCLLLLTYKCVTVASANRHNSCLSTHSTVRTAFLLLLEYLYKFIGGCLY